MARVDSPDYDGLGEIPFNNYKFTIRYSEGKTSVVVFGCDCAAAMTDDHARQVYALLGEYLRDRDYEAAQPSLFDEVAP